MQQGIFPTIFAGQVNALQSLVQQSIDQLSPDTGFAARVLVPANLIHPKWSESDVNQARLSEAPTLSAAGFLLDFVPVSDSFKQNWHTALTKLMSRDPFPADRNSFFFRPVELLGICLGASKLPLSTSEQQWFSNLFKNGEPRISQQDLWSTALTRVAASQFNININWSFVSLPPLEQMSISELALIYWLNVSQKQVATQLGLVEKDDREKQLLLSKLATNVEIQTDTAAAALMLLSANAIVQHFVESTTAINWQIGKHERDAIALLERLFSRFPLFVLTLEDRYNNRTTIEIQDEYDVQDCVHALLNLHFEDVRPEECTPSKAGTTSRTVFLLKRENIMIVAKMTR